MLDPTSLFTYERDVDSRSINATTLLVTLGAFGDSGNVQQHLLEYLSQSASKRLIGSIDADQVLDYTGARPSITLNADHFEGYQPPAIELSEYSDPEQGSFLVLSGPEPNFQWERVAHAVRIVVDQLGITRTVIAGSFPAAIPHTRPVSVTRYASNPDDLVLPQPFPAVIDMKAVFTSVLTLRLGEAGHKVVGLAAQVPSYAHELDYFPAVPALLTAIETEGGPRIPISDGLMEKVEKTRLALDQAAAENEQLAGLIKGFEDHYTKIDGITQETSVQHSQPIPGAERLGDEAEEFLREVSRGDEGTDTPH